MSNPPVATVRDEPRERWWRFGLPLLLLLTALAYLPSLGGGFLNFDDPWLIEQNESLQRPRLRVLWEIWTDFSLATRYRYGAEFLPLRDTSHLLEALVIGIAPLPLHLDNLLIYLCVVATVYRLMRVILSRETLALVATAAFALHPVHVESVAWIAGRKDVLALLFGALSMLAYARRQPRHELWIAFWLLLAMLSKSMSVALPLLFPLLDLWTKRKPNWRSVAIGLVTVALVMPLHLYVGRIVRMTQPVLGGSVSATLATMGPVWLRYVALLLWPPSCSLVHDVPLLANWNALAVSCYVSIVLVIAIAGWLWWKRNEPRLLVAVGLLWLPLLPVSQVIAPLQNQMADRYLWWSVMALAVVLVWGVQSWQRVGMAAALLCLTFWLAITAERASLFGDSALVFADATRKTTNSGVAPYQLAFALEVQGEFEGARAAYEEVWRRTRGHDESSRRATNNLARLEAREGDLERAEAVLKRGLLQFPNDEKMRENLRKVQAMRAR